MQFRRKYAAEKLAQLTSRAPFSPYLQWLALLLLVAILITMGLDTEFWNIAIIVGVPWVLIVSLAYFVTSRRLLAAPTAKTV